MTTFPVDRKAFGVGGDFFHRRGAMEADGATVLIVSVFLSGKTGDSLPQCLGIAQRGYCLGAGVSMAEIKLECDGHTF